MTDVSTFQEGLLVSIESGSGDVVPERIESPTRLSFAAANKKSSANDWNNKLVLLLAMGAWYIVGVGAIVTTKLLLSEYRVHPMVLTFQQMVLASTILRSVLSITTKGGQPWPWDNNGMGQGPPTVWGVWQNHSDFILAAVFNLLDFLASNLAFSVARASFVETIKASDTMTTTIVALAWKVDRLGRAESAGLFLQIAGVMMSTWGNAQKPETKLIADHELVTSTSPTLIESSVDASIVIVANCCFAFRAIFQKRFRSSEGQPPMDDTDFLSRMQQIGAAILLVPLLFTHSTKVWRLIRKHSRDEHLAYITLSALNAVSYATYNLASTYVLSKLTVLQHSSFGCLRRLFIVVATCIFFRVPMTAVGVLGLLTSFIGFSAFTYFRTMRYAELKTKDSEV